MNTACQDIHMSSKLCLFQMIARRRLRCFGFDPYILVTHFVMSIIIKLDESMFYIHTRRNRVDRAHKIIVYY